MFESWEEYRDYLLENLIQKSEDRESLRKQFATVDAGFDRGEYKCKSEGRFRSQIGAILTNDATGTKMKNWMVTHRIAKRGWNKISDNMVTS